MPQFRLYNSFIFCLLSFAYVQAQTHFTLPQNVWRIEVTSAYSKGDWKGHNGKKGWQNYPYTYEGTEFYLTQNRERKANLTRFDLEYGFTNKTTFSIQIPHFKSLQENSIWSVSPDTSNAPLTSLLQHYYPSEKREKGLGDIRLGFNFLLKGLPAWSGRGNYAVYGGIHLVLPFAERLEKFNSTHTDSLGRPVQFSQLPIGEGLTEWEGRAFGEFFKRFRQRLINITWRVSYSIFSRELINNPVTFLWTDQVEADSIATYIGENVLHQKGGIFRGDMAGKVELLPERLFFFGGMSWRIGGRDKYFSQNEVWDAWMASRTHYDSRFFQASQWMGFSLLNTDPLKKIGPLPFEIEAGVKWSVPLLSIHRFGETEIWLKLSSYFQAW